MNICSRFHYLPLVLTVTPWETLKLPAFNKGNSLRGAFGVVFHRLVSVPDGRDPHRCPLHETCPYKLIVESSPPPGSDRLSKNQDIPRPFGFGPPLDAGATYERGEKFEFGLILLGSAVNYLPYFVLAFREVMVQGFGLNRAHCELERVVARGADGQSEKEIYSSSDQVFKNPPVATLADLVNARLMHLSSVPSSLFPLIC
jgi:hypothetical protein